MVFIKPDNYIPEPIPNPIQTTELVLVFQDFGLCAKEIMLNGELMVLQRRR